MCLTSALRVDTMLLADKANAFRPTDPAVRKKKIHTQINSTKVVRDPWASVIYVLVLAILHKQKSHFVLLITETVGGVLRSAAKVN